MGADQRQFECGRGNERGGTAVEHLEPYRKEHRRRLCRLYARDSGPGHLTVLAVGQAAEPARTGEGLFRLVRRER